MLITDMSKQDNLQDYLTDIADAIREKKGTTEAINAQNFSEEIRGIEGGGGGIPTAEWNDVNFYDYEGTILYSYSWDEFVAKNEMPPLPTHHEGLTCQEWNYTLEEVLEQGGRCDIGAIYVPSDGRTKIKVDAIVDSRIDISFTITGGNAYVDWGDETSETYSDSGTMSHEYNAGKYVISIKCEGVLTATSMCDKYQPIATLHIGNNFKLSNSVTFKCDNMSAITYPKGATVTFLPSVSHVNVPKRGNGREFCCNNKTIKTLKSVSIPSDSNSFTYLCRDFFLDNLHFPYKGNLAPNSEAVKNRLTCNINNAELYSIDNCIIKKSTNEVIKGSSIAKIPATATSIGAYAFSYNHFLTSIDIPMGVETFASNAFSYCDNLKKVVFPPSVNTIQNYSFMYCSNLEYIDMSHHEIIPTLQHRYAFQSTPCKFIVPDALYDEWITTANWSSFKNQIVKASEFVEPTNNEFI